MNTIKIGSTGVDVAFLQMILNKNGASPRLVVDGIFGSRTDAALKVFQTKKTTSGPDGIAGPKTWAAIKNKTEIRHRVTLFGQPTTMTCWSAAATMMNPAGLSVGPGGASTGPNGGLEPSLENVTVFVEGMGWRIVNDQSAPPVSTFVNAMRRSPVWIAFASATMKHAVVFSAVITDGDESGNGTAFEVYDPWPVGSGTQYATGYPNRTCTLRSVPTKPQMQVAFIAAP